MQDAAWTAIGGGHHTLVIAPTGSGKTLAAFMHAIDRLFSEQAALVASAPRTTPGDDLLRHVCSISRLSRP
nr:DEAD/DEAH box helicase [Burkholderia ubonensis]